MGSQGWTLAQHTLELVKMTLLKAGLHITYILILLLGDSNAQLVPLVQRQPLVHAHILHPTCTQTFEDICVTGFDQQCDLTTVDECKTVPEQRCTESVIEHCLETNQTQCATKIGQQCISIPETSCQQVEKDVCVKVK